MVHSMRHHHVKPVVSPMQASLQMQAQCTTEYTLAVASGTTIHISAQVRVNERSDVPCFTNFLHVSMCR